jgi:hypothetical protein
MDWSEPMNVNTLSSANETEAQIALHRPSLLASTARHNIMLSSFESAERGDLAGLRIWAFGPPGACAIRVPGRPIVLGDLTQQQCEEFARALPIDSYPGVLGPDETAPWFVAAAQARGARFGEPMPQTIHSLTVTPIHPGAAGAMRAANAADLDLVWQWLVAFIKEATPNDAPPPRETIEKSLVAGRYFLWTVEDVPVSMAGIARSTKTLGAIAPVYTPPTLRGRGYAGSVVAGLCDQAFSLGKSTVCLYTDRRNPASNRCYAKVGFLPVCGAMFFPRLS